MNSKETVLLQTPISTQAAKVPAANLGQEGDEEAAEEFLPPRRNKPCSRAD